MNNTRLKISFLVLLIVSVAAIQKSNAQYDAVANGVASTGSKSLMGTLTTVGNKPVIVNGAVTPPGATIMSGSLVQTYQGIAASVILGSAARVDIAPSTLLTLDFSEASVEVQLKKGCVALTTNQGISGSIVGTRGTIVRTAPERCESVDVCSNGNDDSMPIVKAGTSSSDESICRGVVAGSVLPKPKGRWSISQSLPFGAMALPALNRNRRPAAVSQSAP
jgi:hypothetical protein